MATIVITSTGTLGDFLPFIALGGELQRRGHRVRMAVNVAMHPMVRALGLDAWPCGRAFGAVEAQRVPHLSDHWRRPASDGDERDWDLIDLAGHYRDLSVAVQGADLMIASSIQGAAPMVHESTDIPWVRMYVMPWQIVTERAMATHAAASGCALSSTHAAEDRWYDTVRRSVGLPARADAAPVGHSGASWDLLAASRHFADVTCAHTREITQTGFIFGRESAAFTPARELAKFLDAPAGVVVFTLSSLVVRNRQEYLTMHVEAARRAGVRLLILGGWAGFSRSDLPEDARCADVRFEDHVPHRWLFPKATAVVTHGGIGTIACALEAGCPLVVEPYGNDQMFNAGRARSLGAGIALHPHRLSIDILAHVLRERVRAPGLRSSALAVSAKLALDDGLRDSTDAVETWLATLPARTPRQNGQ